MKHVQEDAARRVVTAEGTVAQMQTAFGVSLSRYQVGTTVFRGRTGSVRIPGHLRGVVEAVLGLDNRPQAHATPKASDPVDAARVPDARVHPAAVLGPAASAEPRPLWAAQVGRLYRFPTQADGTGETIALIELGGGYRPSELRANFRRARLQMPSVTAVAVGSGRNNPGVSLDFDGEVMLDIVVAASIAPGAAIVVYFTDPSDRGFLDAVSTAVHDTRHAPSILAVSWGQAEDTWTRQARAQIDAAFADAAALNVTVLCAAGDHGAWDNGPDRSVRCDFPGSSPNALTCGGTTLIGVERDIVSETVWNDRDGWATGGGISQAFPRPPWQRAFPMPSPLTGDRAGRGVPDVAGNADRMTGYLVYVGGRWRHMGGTSAVAPLYAGLVALLNESIGRPSGALAPTLYGLGANTAVNVFREITSGDNSVPAVTNGDAIAGYRATPGWNACAGLGSIDGSALLTLLTTRRPRSGRRSE